MILKLTLIIFWKDKVVTIVGIAIKVGRGAIVRMTKEAMEITRKIILENLREVILQITSLMVEIKAIPEIDREVLVETDREIKQEIDN